MTRVLVLGGYGTFGGIVSRELAARGVVVVVAGRDRGRAEAFARSLGDPHRGVGVDATRPDDVRALLDGAGVLVCCAGPFERLGHALLDACLDARWHWVDLADDRAWSAAVRARDRAFRERGLTAAYGCSSLPSLSLALAMQRGGAVERARVTLFIGNRNPKGAAAIRSMLAQIGAPIAAPQGTLRGLADPVAVALPRFGRRTAVNFESPEYDLFPSLLGVRAVEVKIAFELPGATRIFALLARRGAPPGEGTARLLDRLGALGSFLGSSGGAVQVELSRADGSSRRAAIVAPAGGQRMAALPCVLATTRLLDDPAAPRGALTGCELLGGRSLLDAVAAEGYQLS